jgi:hypothetical protein
MNFEELFENDIIVFSVQFNIDGLDIHFLQKDKQTEHISSDEHMSVEIDDNDEELKTLYMRLQDAAVHVAERLLVDQRNPPRFMDEGDDGR